MHALTLAGPFVPTAGSWSLAPGVARFTPSFPPIPGTAHVVVVLPAEGAGPWRELVRVTVPTIDLQPSTRVIGIDPGAGRVPENLLRMSVTFSAPMEEGSAAGRLHLRGDDGTERAGALLPMPPELWDRPRRRLTVLLEPGRIKRGLVPNVQVGPPLTAGTSVTFVVDTEIRDAGGAPLVAGAERTFHVGESIRSRVDPQLWDVQWPAVIGGQLIVRFGRSLDRVLLQRCLRVVTAGGRRVRGPATLDQDAQVWTFTSAQALDDCSLHVHPDLEDLAGNSVRRVFDRNLENSHEYIPASVTVLPQP